LNSNCCEAGHASASLVSGEIKDSRAVAIVQ
jgi:hypothetical protein